MPTVLMYRGEALEDFTGPDCRFVSFKKGDPVYVYYKLAGRAPEVWAGSVSTNLTHFFFFLFIGLFSTVERNNSFPGVFDGVHWSSLLDWESRKWLCVPGRRQAWPREGALLLSFNCLWLLLLSSKSQALLTVNTASIGKGVVAKPRNSELRASRWKGTGSLDLILQTLCRTVFHVFTFEVHCMCIFF